MGFGSHWGQVSGILGLVCSRHMILLAGGTVNLKNGEGYVVIIMASLLQH